jgi:tetratricopeptide (TPR) repeat protein
LIPEEEVVSPAPVESPLKAEPPAPPGHDEVLRIGRVVDEAIQRGNGYAIEGKDDLARREYRTALALNRSSVDAYLGLGYLCFIKGQWELSLEHYVRALNIDPHCADAHYGIGRVLLETDRIDEAIPQFQTVLTLNPTHDDARDTLTALGKAA